MSDPHNLNWLTAEFLKMKSPVTSLSTADGGTLPISFTGLSIKPEKVARSDFLMIEAWMAVAF